MKTFFGIYMYDLKVAIANMTMVIAGFADLDIVIKVIAFFLGSVYTIQRIIYNYQHRQEEKALNEKKLNDDK